MKLKLYDIEKEYINLMDAILENEGEITPLQNEQLIINQENLEKKGICYSHIIKDLEYSNEIIDLEIKRLQSMKKTRSNLSERLKSTLKDAMILFGIEELKTATLKVNFRKSESVEVDEAIIDKKYCREKITYAPDKAAIKAAINDGIEVVGATISYNKNIQIR